MSYQPPASADCKYRQLGTNSTAFDSGLDMVLNTGLNKKYHIYLALTYLSIILYLVLQVTVLRAS